jgi:alpha-glucoside transport system substrate-binding protein
MVSDVGGIDDASFNENTWKGLQDAQEQLGVEATFLESQAQADYENNITEFAEQGYDMIITVGFLLGDATYKMAAQYPDVEFAIVDFPTGGDETPNLQGILFNVHEASFPVGYVAAAMADQLDPDDPMVAYIGGMQIPPVEEFIVAYEAGAKYYNGKYGKDVGFTGVYVGDFEAPDQGKVQANSLIDEGADIIMGVGGKTGNGGIAAAKERGKWGVGVDVDQYYTLPNEKDILVTSTIKRLDKAVFSVIKSGVEAKFEGGTNYIATLENEGVGVGPFHDFEDKVPDEIKADLEQIQADIMAKKLWTGWGEPPEGVAVAAEIDCMGAASGDKVTLLYQWSGAEEEKFNAAVKPLVDACGIVIEPESSRDQALMDTRVQAGTPWNVVIWPTTVALAQYPDQLVPLEEAGVNLANYADYWKAMGSVEGKWLAVPVKADIKTIIWYSPVVFEANGYEVPTTWEDLDALVEKMVADGNVPCSMGMESGDATGWTGSDFIQDILLVQQGPEYVMDVISGKVPYDDAGVKAAYETYGKWAKDETYTVGGATGTVSTAFLDAIYKPFSDPPEAMMVKQSGFAGGEVKAKYPDLEYGVDYDFFPVPGAQGMQGGADFLMVFNASPAAKALMAYLTSETGAKAWAAASFDLSPNNKVTGADYPDAALAKKADALAGATGFTPDIGDTIPGGFGKAEWKAIVDYVNDAADLDTALAEAAKVQAEATK